MSHILTNQKVSEKVKDKQWHINHALDYVGFDSTRPASVRRESQIRAWKAYMCMNDLQAAKNSMPITNPYGLSLGMEYIAYPLVESKLEQMVGEFMARGIKRKSYVINKRAQSAKLDNMFDMMAEEILRETNVDVNEELGFDVGTESPDKELPPNLEEFFEQGYKTVSESVSDIILTQVLIGKKQMDKIKDLYLDFLIYDECATFIETKDGQPFIRRCSLFETDYDFDPDEEVQKNPQYVVFNKVLAYNEIINTFDLTKEEEDILKTYLTVNSNSNIMDNEDRIDGTGYDGNYSNWITGDKNNLRIRSVEMHWISQKKISVKVSINKKTGKKIYKSITDDYEKRNKDEIESVWVQEKRKVVMIGPDLCLEYGVNKERASRIDDPTKDAILFTAIKRNNTQSNSQIRSAATKLIQLQEFASECLFELRLAMRRNNGRVLVYDAAQIPKQYLKDGGYKNAINRVMHHAKKDQFLIINSADKQSRYAFNQFTSLDMSTKGMMQDLFNVLALIEDLASKFLGLSPEREGNIDQYQSATGTERAVTQSTARTEVYVKPFESFIKYVMDNILIKGRYVYEENEVTELIFGDLKSKFFTIAPEYFTEDVGVYIADNYAEQKAKSVVDNAAQQALSNAATPDLILSLIQTLNADTASESEAIFKTAVKTMNALKQQEQEFQAEQAKAQQEAAQALDEKADAREKAKLQNNIDVAIIQTNGASMREGLKLDSQNAQKLADIEAKLMMAEQKKAEN